MKWAVISTWKMSFAGNVRAAEMLSKGCKCGDAIIEGVSMVEDDPGYSSVGYSGLPDRDGRVTLDGGYMDGDTLKVGAVGCIEGFRSPVRIARSLADKEFNNFLVGAGAEEYAETNGFEKRNNLTEGSYQRYLQEKDKLKELNSYDGHDTVVFVGRDVSGTVCTAVSTSGLFMKEHGRVGDSPIPGCGFYADSFIGGAGATGVGEDANRGTVSYRAINKLKEGKTAMQAAQETIDEIMERIENCRHMSIVVLDKDGNYGVATNCAFPFVYASDECEPTLYLATRENGKTSIRQIRPEEWSKD